MKIGKQARRDAKTLFHACRVDGVLDESRVRQAVQQVVAGKPRGYVGILEHFQRLVKLDIDRRSAVEESARPLDAAFQARLNANLESRHGRGLQVRFVENADLVGGLRIRVGSDIYDGSIAGRLAALESSL